MMVGRPLPDKFPRTQVELGTEILSRRQYFYDLKASLEALADAMVREHQAKLQAQAHR